MLLTRAAEDAARTQDRLEARGHIVMLSPVMEMVGIEARWPSGVIDAVLATSGQAFAGSLGGPSPEARRVLPLYLVGARTAEAAARAGFLGAAQISQNAASLAMAFGKLASRPQRIVYLAGRDRKPDIETALEVIGRSVEVVEVYEARACHAPSPEAVKALRQGGLDGILHFSRRSAGLFTAMASQADVDIRLTAHFCLSDDVAAPLREAGCAEIHISEKPNEADLLALVEQVAPRTRNRGG